MNRISHFEIHANDLKRAADFYRNVFAWEIEKWPMPEGMGDQEYWMVMTGPKDSKEQGINGGLLLRNGKQPEEGDSPNAYVCTAQVENIDDIIAKIEENGGKCKMPKFAFPGMAWQAYYMDTEGNIFGIHQPDKNAK